ncbi:UNKNOWN [Stylonychia lemnae]|uniref:Transmembrane protein n=1 Tax=Stylonychia lemnae TaxID=5949 RepID=A0A078B2Z6_STYLE|nr:UNKNOWN [Stylonychia lemnae]|eukprot:CDW88631.1 UNKNOWN [Stylonychia lemnae]
MDNFNSKTSRPLFTPNSNFLDQFKSRASQRYQNIPDNSIDVSSTDVDDLKVDRQNRYKVNNEVSESMVKIKDFSGNQIANGLKNVDQHNEFENRVYKQSKATSIEDLMRLPEKLGPKNMSRLKDLKNQMDQLQSVIADFEQQKVKERVKEDLLIEEFYKNMKFKDDIKQKLYDKKKENMKLDLQLKSSQEEIEDLLQMIQEKNQQSSNPVKSSNLLLNKKMLEDKKRRERLQLKIALANGVDFLGDNAIKVSEKKILSRWEKLKIQVADIIDRIQPFKSEMQQIYIKFDRSINNFFQLFRFLFVFSMITFVLYAYLLLIHFINTDSSEISKICNTVVPCILYYSRFLAKEGTAYCSTIGLFVIIGLIICLYQWIKFDRQAKYQQIFKKDGIIFARMVLNSWNWSVNEKTQQEDLAESSFNEVLFALKEYVIAKRILYRPQSIKNALLFRRVITGLLSIIVIIFGWAGIIAASLYEENIVNYFGKFLPDIVAGFIPTVIVTIVNFIVLFLLEKLTEFEEWDFAYDNLKQLIWRSYVASIMNNLIFIIIQVELASGNAFFGDDTIASFDQANKQKVLYQCREDMVAVNFLQLVIHLDQLEIQFVSEIVTKWLLTLIWMGYYKIRNAINKNYEWIKEVGTPDEVVWIISFQLIIWSTIIYFPYMVFLQPFIMLIQFKYTHFVIYKWKKQPTFSSNEDAIGNFYNTFLTFTFIIVIVIISMFLFLPMDRYSRVSDPKKMCGPYPTNVSVINASNLFFKSNINPQEDEDQNESLTTRYFLSFPFITSIALILISSIQLQKGLIEVYENYKKQKFKDYDNQIEDLQLNYFTLVRKDNLFKDARRQSNFNSNA